MGVEHARPDLSAADRRIDVVPSPVLRIASVNVNGIRAAFRKGMGDWLQERDVDVLALQEVRASTDDVTALLGAEWDVVHDPASAKGRAGVAIASRKRARIHRIELSTTELDSSGRWIEADYDVGDDVVTIASVYVPSGSAGTPKQDEKYRFLDAMAERVSQLTSHNPFSLVTGDLNIGHRTLDIRNWKGNRKNAGFLPEERAYLDAILGSEDDERYNAGAGLGWVDVGRRFAGEVDGPYTWWSQRGRAFDTDTGWRIDYQLATPSLAQTAVSYEVDRASAWDARWSDHAPVVVDYQIGKESA